MEKKTAVVVFGIFLIVLYIMFISYGIEEQKNIQKSTQREDDMEVKMSDDNNAEKIMAKLDDVSADVRKISEGTSNKKSGSAHLSRMVNPETSADIFLVPNEETLNKMSEIQQIDFYLRYVNTLQALCRNFKRVGSLRDGGKEICIDDFYKPKAPCLVYSFGINEQWDFDEMLVDLYGCEVHCFDPSMKRKTGKYKDKIWFYQIGIDDKDWVNGQKWEMKTLKSIRKYLGHENRTIDVLKMDVEEAEWRAIPQMVESGALHGVKQLAVEFHYPWRAQNKPNNWRDEHSNIPLSCLRTIYEAGYRIVMRDRVYVIRKLPEFKYPFILQWELTLIKGKN